MSGFTIDRTYPHPRERVWSALTTPETLARWLMPNDFAPIVGHEFTFRTDPGPGFDGIVRCRVLEVDEPHRLRFTWAGGPIDTIVTFELAETEGGATHLRMTQDGFTGAKAWLVSRILKAGCRTIYGKRLPAVLDDMGAPLDPARCMTPGQGLIVRLLRFLQRKDTR